MFTILAVGYGMGRVVRKSVLFIPLVVTLILWTFPLDSGARALHSLAQTPADLENSTQEVQQLEKGKSATRELPPRQKHRYQVALTAGQYASVTVEQRGIDVLVRVIGADGAVAALFDAERSDQGEEHVELVAESTGTYSLVVESKQRKAPGGTYVIQLVELRPAIDKDRALQQARRLIGQYTKLREAGKYDEALVPVEQALEIRQRELGPEHRDVASVLSLLALVYQDKDDLEKAESLHRRTLKIEEKVFGAEHPEVAITLLNLGTVLQEQGNYSGAEELYQRVLAIWKKTLGPDHQYIPAILNNLAIVYVARGDFVKGEPLYQQAISIQEKTLGGEHLDVAQSLNNLAELYRQKGDLAKAQPMYERSLSIREKKLGPDHPDVAVSLSNLAIVYRGSGDYAKAESLHQRALRIREKELGLDHSFVAASLNNLATIYLDQGQYAKAEPLYKRALAIYEKGLGPNHPNIAVPLNNLADLYTLKGDFAEAAVYLSRKMAVSEYNLGVNITSGSERQKLAYLATLSDQADGAISLHVSFAPQQMQARELAATTILRRKGRVQDAMAGSLAALRRRAGASDLAVLDRLGDTTSRLAKLVLAGPQASLPEHQQQIKVVEEEREELEAEINRRSAGYYQRSQPVDLATVRAAIPETAALIEFAAYRPYSPKNETYDEPHYVAYIVRKEGEIQWKDLGEVKAIDDAIAAVRSAFRDPKRGDVRRLARRVDEKIMEPVRPLIGDATHLLVSPDGELNLIPFEALVDERERYLVERYSFTYLTSGRDLLRLQVPRNSKSNAIVVANPLFGEPELVAIAKEDRSNPKYSSASRRRRGTRRRGITTGSDLADVYFTPLDGTAQEARAIKSLFAEANVLSGAQATESSLKRVAAPRIIHIATHGFFLTDTATPANRADQSTRSLSANVKIENPLLRSGLALAGANLHKGSDDDGILTALEASGLNLWGTKLVTLSACDTGIGEVKSGEGVYGLRRAFMLAGTETLVMSLWPISDYATREIMAAYYRGLKQGRGRGASLREVQLGMLKRKDRAHPFYWASFIQAGEWASLDGRR